LLTKDEAWRLAVNYFAKLPELPWKSGSQKRHLIVAGRTRSLPPSKRGKK
jgi:hypothetical protein